MPVDENKAMFRRFLDELWVKGNVAIVDELFAPGYTMHDPAHPGSASLEDIKKLAAAYRAPFSTIAITIESQLGEGDLVATRWFLRGSPQPESASGVAISISGTSVSRFKDGKIEEEWINWDTLGLLRQMGALPELEQAMSSMTS